MLEVTGGDGFITKLVCSKCGASLRTYVNDNTGKAFPLQAVCYHYSVAGDSEGRLKVISHEVGYG
jgi:hypothetical protein